VAARASPAPTKIVQATARIRKILLIWNSDGTFENRE
jgi:hypothetical protein